MIGAVLWVHTGRGWSSWTSKVTGYDSNTKTIRFPSFKGNWWIEQNHNPSSRWGTFYLSGTLGLLDSPGEWFYDASSQDVFLHSPLCADPNASIVEARARRTGIDLRNRSWVVVNGIDLFACTADLGNARHCTVRGIKAAYIHHTSGGETAHSLGEKSGIHVTGNNNIIRDSEIAHSAGHGVFLAGNRNSVVNCWIHDIGYLGSLCCPVMVRGMRNMVSHTTINDAGRDCIQLTGAEHLVQFNSISRPGRICRDLGNIKTGGNDGGNTQIRFNWIFENPGDHRTSLGIYLDNYSKNYLVHHNVVWNVPVGIRLNRPTGFIMVLNNTVSSEINNVYGPWEGPYPQWGSHLVNNLTRDPIRMNPEVSMLANKKIGEEIQSWLSEDGPSLVDLDGKEWEGVFVPGYHPGPKPRIGSIFNWKPGPRPGHDFAHSPEPRFGTANTPLRNHVRNAAFEYDL